MANMTTALDWVRGSRSSQLYKHLLEILTDSSPLSMLEYFLQFMESVGAVHLVQFWFCVESFKSAVTSTPIQNCHTNAIENMASTGDNSYSLQKTCDDTDLLEKSDVPRLRDISRLESDGKPSLNSDMLQTEVSECAFDRESRLLDGAIGEPDLQCGQSPVSHCVVGSRQSGSDVVGDQGFTERHDDETGISMSRQKSLYVVGDSLEIYSTYVALNAVTPVGIPDGIRQRVEVGICPEKGVVDRSCFSEAQDFVFDVMERRYYPKFLQSPFLCKYQLEYISSGKLRLLDFLFGENALFYFMEYMEQENVSALLQFWLMAESFHTHMSSPSRIPAIEADTADAIVLYERYFSLQATEPLSMGYTVRLDVENRICDEKGPRVDSFAVPQQIAFDTMNKTYFPNFLESAIYLRFLNELIHTLKVSEDNTDSETEAESGVAGHGGASTVAADPDALEDPSSIWRRPSFPMRLGYVDKFGQYVSEIEPPPPKFGRYQGQKKKNSWHKTRIIDDEMAVKISRHIVTEVLDMLVVAAGWSEGVLLQ